MKYQSEISTICKKILSETNKYTISTHGMSKLQKENIFSATSTFPLKITISKRIRAIGNELNCQCMVCGKIHGDPDKEFCSQKCYSSARKEQALTDEEYAQQNTIRIGEQKFADKKEGQDYLVCAICGAKSGDLGSHVHMHGITPKEYKQKYNLTLLKPQRNRDSRKGENNPAFGHGGKYSAWSKNFIHGYDETRHRNAKETHSKFMKSPEGKSTNKFSIEYWLNEANGDKDLAKELYLKFQTKNLEWFINKYGEEEGTRRHAAKTEKWMKSFRACNFSQISQELFNALIAHINCTDVYFATYDRIDMYKYKNKEYILKVDGTYIRPDFIDVLSKKIIEFDGEYWHSPARANQQREELRDKRIRTEGYTVLHVKEYDYKKDKQKVINECLNFLKQ